jgi:hypothetical protein
MADDHSWDRIVDAIDTKFGLTGHGRQNRPVADASHLTESVAFVTFVKDGTTFKLERIQGPAIVDRKTVGARRAGSSVHFENVYDPHETSLRTKMYQQEPSGEWTEIAPESLGL